MKRSIFISPKIWKKINRGSEKLSMMDPRKLIKFDHEIFIKLELNDLLTRKILSL